MLKISNENLKSPVGPIPKKILLLFGGNDGERHVSVASAKNLADSFVFDSYCYLHQSKLYFCSREELLGCQVDYVTEFSKGKESRAITFDRFFVKSKDCYIFNALHGEFGEDGALQVLLEQHGLFFTGSGSEACRDSFDKRKAKLTAVDLGILTPLEYMTSDHRLIIDNNLDVIVKPNKGGSSLGVQFSVEEKFLYDFLNDHNMLVEEKIDGIEVSCGVLDMGVGATALPPIEIKAVDKFDFNSKYLSKKTSEIEYLDKALAEDIKSAALRIHNAVGCKGYSRSDFILSNGQVYFLEINSLPGLTKQSIFIKELKLANITVKEFITSQLR